MRRAITAATAPIRSSMSASMSARSWRRWSAARSAKRSAGITALPPPASACASGLRFISTRCRCCRRTNCSKARAAHVERKPLDRDEWRAIVALLVLFVPNTLFWATYEQMGNTTVLWADANTDRTLSPVRLRRANSDHVVSRLQSVHDLRLHAVRRRAVDAAGGARHASLRPSPRWRSAVSA